MDPQKIEKIESSLPFRTAVVLVAAAIAGLALVAIARSVLLEEAGLVDGPVTRWVRQLHAPVTDRLMRGLTVLGDPPVIIGVVALVFGWAIKRQERALAVVLVAVAVSADGLNRLLKVVFARARPHPFGAFIAPTTYSFPSGHAMITAAAYGMAAVVAVRLRPSLRIPLAIVTPLLVLLVGASRVYLGAHWPTDVLGGFAAGGLVFMGGLAALAIPDRRAREPR